MHQNFKTQVAYITSRCTDLPLKLKQNSEKTPGPPHTIPVSLIFHCALPKNGFCSLLILTRKPS